MNRLSTPVTKPLDLQIPCPRCGDLLRFTGAVIKVRDGELRVIYEQANFDRMYLEHSFEDCGELHPGTP